MYFCRNSWCCEFNELPRRDKLSRRHELSIGISCQVRVSHYQVWGRNCFDYIGNEQLDSFFPSGRHRCFSAFALHFVPTFVFRCQSLEIERAIDIPTSSSSIPLLSPIRYTYHYSFIKKLSPLMHSYKSACASPAHSWLLIQNQ